MALDEIVVEATAMRVRMGDLVSNYYTMLDSIRDAAARGVDLIVMPEMATCGYVVGDELEMDRFLVNNKKVVEKLIEETKDLDIAVAVGYVDYVLDQTGHDGRMRRYNSAMVFQHGEIKGVIDKNLLPNYTLFDERRWFTPGTKLPIIPIQVRGKEIKLGVGICEMKWAEDYVKMVEQDFVEYQATSGLSVDKAKETFHFDEKINYANPAKSFQKQGAELLVWLNASPFHSGKINKIDAINKARIKETGLPMVDVNLVGIGDNVWDLFGFDGQSAVLDANGEYVARTRPWKEESAVARVHLKSGLAERVHGFDPVQQDYVDQVLDGLVNIFGMYMQDIGMQKAIISMSGGIDSSLGAAIAAMARDADYYQEVRAFTFPTEFNTSTTKGYAHQVAKSFAIPLEEISIQEKFESEVQRYAKRKLSSIDYSLAEDASKTKGIEAFYGAFTNPNTPENIQARIRSEEMKILANEIGAIEIVNPNKDERRMGYTTLWGDMAGLMMILGDLPKWLVRAVSERVNERFGSEYIPPDLIHNLKPSAELSRAQNPEKGGGDPFDYDALGIVLDQYHAGRKDVPDIVEAFRQRRFDFNGAPVNGFYEKYTDEQIDAMARETIPKMEFMRYKSPVAPLSPKVTRRTAGFEFRTPVTSTYHRTAAAREELGFY